MGGGRSPGYGIPTMAFLDGLILFSLGLIGVSIIISGKVQGVVETVSSFIVSLIVIVTCFVLLFVILAELILMIALLFAPIFGTIAYFALYADFPVATAKIALGSTLSLKLVASVFLVFAHQRFLENKKLIFIIATSLLCNLIISFLHGFVPGFLVSITDAVAGIIMVIPAIIWAIIYLVGSIMSALKLMRR
jgi:hypothetical protein